MRTVIEIDNATVTVHNHYAGSMSTDDLTAYFADFIAGVKRTQKGHDAPFPAISTIKLIRSLAGIGLKESKDLYDRATVRAEVILRAA